MMELSIGPKAFQVSHLESIPGQVTLEFDDWAVALALAAFPGPHPLTLDHGKVVHIQAVNGVNGRIDFVVAHDGFGRSDDPPQT